MGLMRSSLANLLTMNSKLINSVSIASKQKDLLTEELKKMKAMINKAGNLRCSLSSLDGDNKTRVVSLCRQAIQDKNFFSMINIITKESV